MKYCKHCGAPMKDDAKFCVKCGKSVPGGEQTGAGRPPEPPKPPKKKSMKPFIIGCCAVIVVMVIGTGVFVAGKLTETGRNAAGIEEEDDREEKKAEVEESTTAPLPKETTAVTADTKPVDTKPAETTEPSVVSESTTAPIFAETSAVSWTYPSGVQETAGLETAGALETTAAFYLTYYVVNCRESITLRTSPSTSAGEICQIPLGAPVSYVEAAESGFYKIIYNGKTGYGLASYLSQDKPDASVSANTILTVVNCQESITLRPSPSTSSGEICQIPLGATVTYVESASNGFYKVTYNGQTGYALASYLEER